MEARLYLSDRVLQAFQEAGTDDNAFLRKAGTLQIAVQAALQSYEAQLTDKERRALVERVRAAHPGEAHFLRKDPPKIERNEDLPFREILPLGPLARLAARAVGEPSGCDGSFCTVSVCGGIEDDGEDLVSLRCTVFRLKSFLAFYCPPPIGPLPSIGAVDKVLVGLCFEKIREEQLFHGKEVLDSQEEFFRALSCRPKAEDYAIVAGEILHGEPGTGKTYLLTLMARLMAMASITETISVGEMEIGGLKGDMCNTLRAVLERPKDFPWLPCFLIIDEIDTLAPDRLRSNQEISESKQGAIGLLITLFKGGRQVPNLYLLGTTNRYDSMDDALLRRVGHEHHMGTLAPELREVWLRPPVEAVLRKGAYSPAQCRHYRRLVTAASNAFSGDACMKLARCFAASAVQRGGAFADLCASTLATIEVGMSRVPFGHSTAATVLQAALPTPDAEGGGGEACAAVEAAVQWLQEGAEEHSGKLFGDLFSGTVEASLGSVMGDDGENCVEALAFLPSCSDGSSNVRASYDMLLSAVLLFCAERNIARCELVTAGSLALCGYTTANDAKKRLYAAADMQAKYPSSLLVIDVDSLVAVEPQAAEKLVGGAGCPPFIQDELLHACVDVFSFHSQPRHQVMLLCSKKQTACLLSQALAWRPSVTTNVARKRQKHSREVMLARKICQSCGTVFSPIENGPFKCRSHTCAVEDENGVVVATKAKIRLKLRQRCALFHSCNSSPYSPSGGSHDGCALQFHKDRGGLQQ